MYRLTWLSLILVILLCSSSPAQAQTEAEPPDLYYYSRIPGGLIIERADGTDRRLND